VSTIDQVDTTGGRKCVFRSRSGKAMLEGLCEAGG